jgi:hypothetical protein
MPKPFSPDSHRSQATLRQQVGNIEEHVQTRHLARSPATRTALDSKARMSPVLSPLSTFDPAVSGVADLGRNWTRHPPGWPAPSSIRLLTYQLAVAHRAEWGRAIQAAHEFRCAVEPSRRTTAVECCGPCRHDRANIWQSDSNLVAKPATRTSRRRGLEPGAMASSRVRINRKISEGANFTRAVRSPGCRITVPSVRVRFSEQRFPTGG